MNVVYSNHSNKYNKLYLTSESNKLPFNLIKYGNIYRYGVDFNSNMCWDEITNSYTSQMCWNGSTVNFIMCFKRFFNKPNISYIIEDYDNTKEYYSLMVSCVYRDITFGIFEGINYLLESGLDVIRQNMLNSLLCGVIENENKFRTIYNEWVISEKEKFVFRFNRPTNDISITISKMRKI